MIKAIKLRTGGAKDPETFFFPEAALWSMRPGQFKIQDGAKDPETAQQERKKN